VFHTIFRSKYSFKKVKRPYLGPNKLADHVKRSSNATHLRERVTKRKRLERAVGATSAGRHQETCLPVCVRSCLRKWEHTCTYVPITDDGQQHGRLRFSAVALLKLIARNKICDIHARGIQRLLSNVFRSSVASYFEGF